MFRTDIGLKFVVAALLGLLPLKGNAGNTVVCPHCFLSNTKEIFLSGASPLCGAENSCVYLEPPEDFDFNIEVAGCFCEHRGKVLYLLRNPDKPQGNTWCVPGGKLEEGETPRDAIIREVNEETGIQIDERDLHYCNKVFVRFPGRDLVLHLFRANLTEVPEILDIAISEHSTYRWVTLEEALSMPLIPGGSDCLLFAFSKGRSY